MTIVVVEPTEPNAKEPANRPTTATSDMVKRICRTLESTRGRLKSRMLLPREPSVMSRVLDRISTPCGVFRSVFAELTKIPLYSRFPFFSSGLGKFAPVKVTKPTRDTPRFLWHFSLCPTHKSPVSLHAHGAFVLCLPINQAPVEEPAPCGKSAALSIGSEKRHAPHSSAASPTPDR